MDLIFVRGERVAVSRLGQIYVTDYIRLADPTDSVRLDIEFLSRSLFGLTILGT